MYKRQLHAMAFQRRAHAFGLLRLHGDIHQSLAIAQHITAGAAHCARKAVVPQQRFGHAVVAAGDEYKRQDLPAAKAEAAAMLPVLEALPGDELHY